MAVAVITIDRDDFLRAKLVFRVLIHRQMAIKTVLGIIQCQLIPSAVDAFRAHADDESLGDCELGSIIIEIGRIFGNVAIHAFERAFLTFAADAFINVRAGFVFVLALERLTRHGVFFVTAGFGLAPRAFAAGVDSALMSFGIILAFGFGIQTDAALPAAARQRCFTVFAC